MRCVSVFLTGYGRFTKQDYLQLYHDYKETSVADVLSHRLEQLMLGKARTRAVYQLPAEEVRKNQRNIMVTSCSLNKNGRS